MTDQHDQVQDEVGRALRIALAAAAALADRVARAHRDRVRDSGAAVLQPAMPRAEAHTTRWDEARAAADTAAAGVATAIRARTGLDVSAFTASPDTVRAALQHVQDQPASARPAARDDVAAAITAVTTANRLEQTGVEELTDLYRLGQQYRQAAPTAARDAAELQDLDRAGGRSDQFEQGAVLLAEVDRYRRDAAVPGLDPRTADQLQALAVDARAQADLYRQDPIQSDQTNNDQAADVAAASERAAAQYDSHARRLADRDARIAAGVPTSTADTALEADFAQGVPPQAAIASRSGQDPARAARTHRDRGRGTSREDRFR